jgi:DNA-binding NtrC family response regulator
MGQVRDLITSSPQMEWIALVPKELLLVRDVAEVICTGFYDYHTLPADPERLMTVLGRAYGMVSLRIEETNCGATARTVDFDLVGASEKIQGVRRTIRKLANAEAPILVSGESGTGKELAARALHRQSRRASGPFVAVNCGALPRTLIQSELFGHEKGAFTGAHARNIGHIEASGGGTIFLDEVADLSPDLQVNLLRFLQEGTIERVGSTRPIQVDTRVIAASNTVLENAVAHNQFRTDLFYRLNVFRLEMPPLRAREGDPEMLAQFFFGKFSATDRHIARGFSREALHALSVHSWPGNVRELMNRVRRAMVMSDNRLITPGDLELDSYDQSALGIVTLEQSRAVADTRLILDTLKRTKNNLTQAARDLGVSRTTLYRLLKRQPFEAVIDHMTQRFTARMQLRGRDRGATSADSRALLQQRAAD